jgi:hypothetical protein
VHIESRNVIDKTKHSDGFYMRGLRKQVNPSYTLKHILPVSLFQNSAHISSLRVYVATNVNHSTALECQQLFDEIIVTPLPRWIDDKHCVVSGKVFDCGKDIRSITSMKGALPFWEIIQPSIVCCELDGIRRELDACDGSKIRRERYGKKAAPTICVDEMGWRWHKRLRDGGEYGFPHIICEWKENRVVVLEERPSLIFEEHLPDLFPYSCIVIRDTDMLFQGRSRRFRGYWCYSVHLFLRVQGIPEKQGRSLFEAVYCSTQADQRLM